MINNHFFIVGGQRCGTTLLYHLLDQHPEIQLAKPVRPEPKYFINKALYSKGLDYYYSKYFKPKEGIKILGEKSTSYHEYPESLIRISKHFPDCKILFCLRNPIYRAISNFQFSVENKLESRSAEETFLDGKEIKQYIGNVSVNPFNYLGRGDYRNYIQRLQSIFRSEQIFYLIMEEFISIDYDFSSLFQHLGVNPDFVPEFPDAILNASEEIEPVSEKIILRLRDYYSPMINDLENLINQKLDIWNL